MAVLMEDGIGIMLAQVARLVRRKFDEHAREIGVTRPQWQVLSILGSNAGINQGELAELLEVEPITAGRMIDRLQDADLVVRRSDPADRRAWRLHLTVRGEQMLGQLRPLADHAIEEAMDGIGDEGRGQFATILRQMRCNLSRRPQHVEASVDG